MHNLNLIVMRLHNINVWGGGGGGSDTTSRMYYYYQFVSANVIYFIVVAFFNFVLFYGFKCQALKSFCNCTYCKLQIVICNIYLYYHHFIFQLKVTKSIRFRGYSYTIRWPFCLILGYFIHEFVMLREEKWGEGRGLLDRSRLCSGLSGLPDWSGLCNRLSGIPDRSGLCNRLSVLPDRSGLCNRLSGAPGLKRALEQTLWAPGLERALEQTLWAPGLERAL